ncbi:winged helix-turn-helix domain-containing protein [Natronorarus salvus]|uniref:winged helix-turn-helix domain-containing protein n=1 Tax=Natronorarus salvus TaxID=3117733 RepID=UPI002F265461
MDRSSTPQDSETDWSWDRECDPDRFASVLADPVARAMFERADEPITVGELAVELDLPSSTAYRKVATLCETGLLTELRRFRTDDPPSEYVRTVDSVSVVYDDVTSVECVTNGITVCRTEG